MLRLLPRFTRPDTLFPYTTRYRSTESTSPKLSPLLFDEAIKERRQTLVNWIEGNNEHPFVIVADSADEALAFLARALLEPDGTAGVLHDRAVLATDADALEIGRASCRDRVCQNV